MLATSACPFPGGDGQAGAPGNLVETPGACGPAPPALDACAEMPILQAWKAGITKQYTLRGVPDHVDRALRERAATYGRSLNRVALEALELGLDWSGKRDGSTISITSPAPGSTTPGSTG